MVRIYPMAPTLQKIYHFTSRAFTRMFYILVVSLRFFKLRVLPICVQLSILIFFLQKVFILFSIFLVFFFGKLLKLATGKVFLLYEHFPEEIIAVALCMCVQLFFSSCANRFFQIEFILKYTSLYRGMNTK